MAIAADLHIHTLASDGLLTSEEVVMKASGRGLLAIAVTDHDTTDGLEEAAQAAGRYALELIPGIELSTEYRNKEIHILGYYIDPMHNRLSSLLREIQQSRTSRAEKMVVRLSLLGKEIAMEEVLEMAGSAAPSRPHIARVLLEKGFVSNVKQAFDELIGHQGPAYVERYKMTTQEAISLIREAGGTAVWAHPGLTGIHGFLGELIKAGLQGLEVYHPEHNWVMTHYYRSLAQKHGLIVTGGSDYHGNVYAHAKELGACGVTKAELEALRRK